MTTPLSEQIYRAAVNDLAAQQAIQEHINQSPRVVYCLWQGDTLLGICGTPQRAEQEREMYQSYQSGDIGPKVPIKIEHRVMHS